MLEYANYIYNIVVPLLPGIIASSISINIVIPKIPETIKNIVTRHQNKKRNYILAQTSPYNPNFHYVPIKYAKFTNNELISLEKAYLQTKIPVELQDLVQEFKQQVSANNFTTCIKNLQTLQLNYHTKNKEKLIKTKTSGEYSNLHNTITLFGDKIRRHTLSHEFLHLASSIRPGQCGFHVFTKSNQDVGRGINEGYTELLNQRLFNSDSKSYTESVRIARLFEIFFDDPKEMEDAYFHGNFNVIYSKFCDYGTKEEFYEIMNNLDNLATTTPTSLYNKITSIKTQLKLYEMIQRSYDINKIYKFKQILDEQLLTKLLSDNKKLVLANKPKVKNKTI